MKIVKYILIISSSLLLGLFLFGLFLPSEYKIERKIEIEGSLHTISNYITDLTKWEEWSYMSSKKDSTMKFVYKDSQFGKNSIANWKSEYMGEGILKIYDVQGNHKIHYEIIIGENDHRINGTFTLDSLDGKVRLGWIDYGELGINPIARIFGMFMEKFIGKDQEESLQHLKKIIEHS